MATVHDSFVGFGEEVTWATAIAPTRFFEFTGESIAGKYERIESEALRSGTKVLRVDRFQVNPKGAEGDVKLEVLDKGFGLLLKHMLGSVAVGAPAGGFSTQTHTIGTLLGKGLTCQVGRVDNSGVLTPFTYSGGKVASWELSNAVDGVLELSASLDFASEKGGAGAGAFALAVPTYPAGSSLFTFTGGAVTIAGTEFAVTDASVKGDNSLKADRYFLRTAPNQTVKKEPLEEGMRKFEVELKGEFDGLTHYNRVASATAAGAVATTVLTWDCPSGAQLKVTLQNHRFDEMPINSDGAKIVDAALKGVALDDGTNSPVKIEYKSADVAA